MSETLYLWFGNSPDENISYLQLNDTTKEIIASGDIDGSKNLISLKERLKISKISVFVSSAKLSFFNIEIINKAALKGIEFMLEDNFVNDIEQMHVALGSLKNKNQQVVATTHEQMQMWLSWLDDAKLKAKALIPDVLALDFEKSTWSFLQLNDYFLIKTQEFNGFATNIDSLITYIDAALDSKKEININSFTRWPFDKTDEFIIEDLPCKLPLEALAKNANKTINLCQKKYKQKSSFNLSFNILSKQNLLIFSILTLFISSDFIGSRYKAHQTKNLNKLSNSIYLNKFPKDKGLLKTKSASEILASRVNNNSYKKSNAVTLDYFETIIEALMSTESLKMESLRFLQKQNKFTLRMSGDDFNVFEELKNKLTSDFKVDLGSMSKKEKKVNTQITLEIK